MTSITTQAQYTGFITGMSRLYQGSHIYTRLLMLKAHQAWDSIEADKEQAQRRLEACEAAAKGPGGSGASWIPRGWGYQEFDFNLLIGSIRAFIKNCDYVLDAAQ